MQLRVPQPDVMFAPHPEGIFAAVCVDVIDLGMQTREYMGESKQVHKVRIVFETEQVKEDGSRFMIARMFTASLHPKGRLAQALEKWRGRPFQPDEVLDLNRLIGVGCTLVISQIARPDGTSVAVIDAIAKPTKNLVPSGVYDPKAARDKIAAARAGDAAGGMASRGPVAKPGSVVPQPAAARPVMPAVSVAPAAVVQPEEEAAFF